MKHIKWALIFTIFFKIFSRKWSNNISTEKIFNYCYNNDNLSKQKSINNSNLLKLIEEKDKIKNNKENLKYFNIQNLGFELLFKYLLIYDWKNKDNSLLFIFNNNISKKNSFQYNILSNLIMLYDEKKNIEFIYCFKTKTIKLLQIYNNKIINILIYKIGDKYININNRKGKIKRKLKYTNNILMEYKFNPKKKKRNKFIIKKNNIIKIYNYFDNKLIFEINWDDDYINFYKLGSETNIIRLSANNLYFYIFENYYFIYCYDEKLFTFNKKNNIKSDGFNIFEIDSNSLKVNTKKLNFDYDISKNILNEDLDGDILKKMDFKKNKFEIYDKINYIKLSSNIFDNNNILNILLLKNLKYNIYNNSDIENKEDYNREKNSFNSINNNFSMDDDDQYFEIQCNFEDYKIFKFDLNNNYIN